MIPPFQSDGNLPPGIHTATWEEIAQRFGGNPQRAYLLAGLRRAVGILENAGCRRVYINGSFVTSKAHPGDFDASWETEGVDFSKVAPILLDRDDLLNRERRRQKAEFGGELIPEGFFGMTPLAFFQKDDRSGQRKGIVAINLGEGSHESNGY